MEEDNFTEPNYINYNSVPSLESMAIVNIAIGLCGQSDIRDAMCQHYLNFDSERKMYRETSCNESFYEIEKKILNKLSISSLPSRLKVKVSNIIRPIHLQIFNCIRNDSKDIDFMNFIVWTSVGTIDRVETLKELIQKDSGQHTNSFYQLACDYCLEDSVATLWKKLPKDIQYYYRYDKKLYEKYDSHLIAYWTAVVKNDLNEFNTKIKQYDYEDIYKYEHSIYNNMFTLALSEGKIEAVKYFWNKLSVEEIICDMPQWVEDAILKRKADGWNIYYIYQNTNKYADVLHFLLSKLDDVEQNEVVQQNSFFILNSLFKDWPWQRILLPTMRNLCKYLSEDVYVHFLLKIVPEIKEGKTTEKLLRELWCESPDNLKRCFIEYAIGNGDLCYTDILFNLLEVEDVTTMIEILDHANIEEKKLFLFSAVRNRKLFKLIYADKLCTFNVLLEETLPSKSDINNIKDQVVQKYGSKLFRDWLIDCNWQMLEKFLNWAYTSQEQIDNFKSNILDKTDITYSLLKRGNLEVVNKFLNWCFHSEQEINRFKKNFKYRSQE